MVTRKGFVRTLGDCVEHGDLYSQKGD